MYNNKDDKKSEDNFAKKLMQNNLPPLEDVWHDVWQAGGRLICNLFAGELIKGKLIHDNYLKERQYNSDDAISDRLMVTEKRTKITHFLNTLSYEIPFRNLNDFPDNEQARKIMLKDLAGLIDDTLEDEKRIPSSKQHYKNIDETREAFEETEEQTEDPHKPSEESSAIAERVISAMENKARELLPKKLPTLNKK